MKSRSVSLQSGSSPDHYKQLYKYLKENFAQIGYNMKPNS